MKYSECAHEKEVLSAISANRLDEEMTAHLAHCTSCCEAVQIARFLRALASEDNVAMAGNARAFPSADLIRWKAQLFEKRSASERVTRAITITHLISAFIILLSLSIWAALRWSQIAGTLERLKNEWEVARLLTSLNVIEMPLMILGLSALLICLMLLLTLRLLLADNVEADAGANS
jgi:hypothetical protein